MPYAPPPDLSQLSLTEIADLAAMQVPLPVENWNPEETGDSGMRIAANGRWYHLGGEIKRPAMVRAFSTLLRREQDGSHALVTPRQKLSIIVEDTPFLAVEVESEGQGTERRLAFRLNTDHLVIASTLHPLEFAQADGQPRPLLTVRPGLLARLVRPVYYQLMEWLIAEDADPPGLYSEGAFFALDMPE